MASLKAEHREVLEEYRRLLRRLIDLLNRGIEAGQIRPCNPVVTIRAIVGALDWSFYWLYEMPREQAHGVNVLRDLLTHGLLASPERAAGGEATTMPALPAEDEAFDREAQNRLKQEAFLKAGTRCFNQKGFSGTSLDEIAEQLQVSKGAFYYHFANKEALLTQCFDYTLDQLEQRPSRASSNWKHPLRSSRQPVGISSYCRILLRARWCTSTPSPPCHPRCVSACSDDWLQFTPRWKTTWRRRPRRVNSVIFHRGS